jgi:cytochrome P450
MIVAALVATRSIADLPGPPGLPMLGNLHQVRTESLHATVEEWCERYGPIFRLRMGPRPIVVIDDLEEIGRILRDRPDGFRRWREMKSVFDEMGTSGVFSEEGEGWRRQRRLAVTALNSNHLQRYFHVIQTATGRLHHRLEESVRDGRDLDITEELTSLTVDVTSALAFGHDLNTLERRDNELQEHLQRTFEMIARRVFAPVPYWRWVRLPADRALDRSLSELHDAIAGFIEQARERMASRSELFEEPENFLEGMLAAQRADNSFSDEEIIGNVFTLLLAGEDTTAHTMAWTLWFLSSRPEIQERWAREAREALGEQPFPVDHQTVERLHYGEAVLRESMRLKPVAVALALESLHDTTIAGTRIPAGTRLWLATRHAGLQAVQRADVFDPERWLKDREEAGGAPDQKAFLAFGGGPRFCPGRNLAFLESKTTMAMFARNFEVELDEAGGPVTEKLSFTLIPQGLRIRLRKRSTVPA